MKFLKKTLSVGLSLVLCASMIAPAFAASFADLQDAINSNQDTGFKLDDNKWGYGAKTDSENNTTYGVIAWDETTEEGKTNRNVQLNDAVERDSLKEGTSYILIGKDANVTIDLNGNNIDGKKTATDNALIEVKGGNLTIKDGTATTENDAEGNKVYKSGAVTGANNSKFGGGVAVTGNGSFTLSSGSIKNNNGGLNGGGVYVGAGTFTMNNGLIDNNTVKNHGGGVFLNAELAEQIGAAQGGKPETKFTMNGGTISNNKADNGAGGGGGGGISAVLQKLEVWGPLDYTAIALKGGSITDNYAGAYGGGIYLGTATMDLDGAIISNNSAKSGAGLYVAGESYATMKSGSITGNTAQNSGGGLYLNNQSQFDMSGGTLHSNSATGFADDACKAKGTILKLPSAASMGVKGKDENGKDITQDGKDITGWYWDGSGVYNWGDKEDGSSYYATQNNNVTVNAETDRIINTALYLKAAHNQYFNVSYYLDEDATDLYNGDFEAEKGFALPEFNVDTPEKRCHTFDSWNVVDGVDENGKVTGDVKYVAQWTENHTPGEAVRENEVPAQVGVAGSYDEVVYCSVCGEELSREARTIPALPVPTITVEDPDVPLGDEPEVEITDPAIPLAVGPVTRAQFVDYLWRHEGEPAPVQDNGLFEDVTVEHEYSPAMAWAKSIGIIEAYEDGTFEPDELVTVAAVRSILTQFAAYADMAMPELTTLTGGDNEAVLNCDQVLAEFFGKEYTASDADGLEIDTAA